MDNYQPSQLQRLARSFGKLFVLIETPKIARRVVAGLLVVHTGLLAYSAYVHSPTLNEPGHLVAGLSHWKFERFELYRVNPPLVRMVAALPVMAAGYEDDWSGFFEGPGARPAFKMGEDFVAANGERSFFLFMIARWACLPLSWIGGVVCFLWARDLYGRAAGVMACTLWCFSPNILAHASLITADASGSALGVAACYTFWRWLINPTWLQTILTGIVLGLAELTKTTLILFYPLWPLLWLGHRWKDRHQMVLSDWSREAGMLLLRMAIGIYILNLGYGFEGSGKPLKEYRFISNLFTGKSEVGEDQDAINRFSDTCLGSLPVPFPKNYLQGIDIQQRDFENYGRPSYLRGEWRDHGWWYYYMYAALIKVPLGAWGMGVICLVLRIRNCGAARFSNTVWRDELVLLLPPLVILSVCSMKTGFSEHFRYVLPIFPFLFIWMSFVFCNQPAQQTVNKHQNIFDHTAKIRNNSAEPRQRFGVSEGSFLVTVFLLIWLISSSLWIYPHSLSYFNESIGGPRNGTKHLLGSNIDWGQDFRYLKAWITDLEEMDLPEKVYLTPNSLYDVGALGVITEPMETAIAQTTSDRASFPAGCYVVSVNKIETLEANWRSKLLQDNRRSQRGFEIPHNSRGSFRITYSIQTSCTNFTSSCQ